MFYNVVNQSPEIMHSLSFDFSFAFFSGRGNSGFELADGIMGATNLIHMLSRSRVRLAWSTHYVGDLRYSV